MSKSIHKLIADYISETYLESDNYRIIIPGLTKKFSEALQKVFFKEQERNSFLTKTDGTANEDKNWIHPSACTSNREKNVIFIFSPGELSFVQEGIKSITGGTANSIWDESFPLSSEHLDKFETILNKIWDHLSINSNDWDSLNLLIIQGINQSLNEGETLDGLNILFDEILHNFSDETNYRKISNMFSSSRYNSDFIKFCYSTNLPLTTVTINDTSDVQTYITQVYNLYSEIEKQVQGASISSLKEELIESIEHKISDIDSKNYLKEFIEELLLSEGSSYGILKYNDLFKRIKKAYENDSVKLLKIWEALSLENLINVFNVRPRSVGQLVLKNIKIIGKGETTSEFKKVIITKDSYFNAEIKYNTNLTSQELEEGSLELKISGTAINEKEFTKLPSAASDIEFKEIELLNDHKLFKKNCNIRVSLRYRNKEGILKNLAEKSFKLYVAHEKESNSIIILKGHHSQKAEIFPFHTIKEDEADDFEINDDVDVTIISDIPESNLEINYDKRNLEYDNNEGDNQDVIYKLNNPIPNDIVTENLLRIKSDNHTYHVRLEFDLNIRGEFSIEDELFKIIPTASKSPAFNSLHGIFKGSKKPAVAYKKLGNINNLNNILAISKLLEENEERGFLPFFVRNNFNKISPTEKFINHDESDINELKTNLKNILLSQDALKLLKFYSECRYEFINFISSKFDESSLLRKHPKYCQIPYFIYTYSNEIEGLIANYLNSFKDIQDFISSQESNSHDQIILSNLDKIILIDERTNDPSLYILNPWHPIVVYNRYVVQKNLYNFADALKNKREEKYCFSETVKLLKNNLHNEITRNYDISLGRLGNFKFSNLSLSPWVISSNIDTLIEDSTYLQLDKSLSLRLIENNEANKNFLNVIKNFKKTYPHKNSFSICFDDKSSINYDIIRSFSEDELLEKNIKQIHVLSEGYSIDRTTENCEEILEKKGKNLFIYQSSWDNNLKKDILVSRSSNEPAYNSRPPSQPLLKSYGRDECSIYAKSNKLLTNTGNSYRSTTTFNFENNPLNNSSIAKIYNDIRNKNKFEIVSEQNEVLPSDSQKNFRWLYMPSNSVDAAALILYLKNHDSNFNLWDFNFDLYRNSSYFIVSEAIPSLSKQIEKHFSSADDIIKELGLNGISLSNEALRNTSAFKGAMGLACAFKSFKDSGYFKNSLEDKELTFTIPVDSFKGVFANKSNTDENQKFSDIIAINLKIFDEKLFIKAHVIEAKFRTKAVDDAFYQEVQEQLKATRSRLDLLISNSLKSCGIPERLLLLELISFGLRTQYDEQKESAFLRFEAEVYQRILNNSFVHDYTKTQLVSLEHEKPITSCEPSIQREGDGDDPHSKTIILTYNKDHNPFTKSDLYKASINYADRLDNFTEDSEELTSDNITDDTTNTNDITDENPTLDDLTDGTTITNNITDETSTSDGAADDKAIVDEDSRDSTGARYQIPNTTIGVFQDDRSKAELNIKSCANKNVLVCGSSGKGKTSLLKYLVHKYVKYHESCFIFDVVSNDFSKDEAFTKKNDLIQVNVKNDGLPFNPLIPKANTINGEQVYNIKDHSIKLCKALAFACDFISNHTHITLLFDVINEVYEDSGIAISKNAKCPNDNYQFPTFALIMKKLKEISRAAGPDRNSANLLRSRFIDIDNDEILENQTSSIGAILDDKRYLINLTGLDNSSIALCLSVFLTFAENYFSSENAVTYSKTCIVIDEAHRLGKLETLSKYARECRKWGVSMILSSQGIDDFTDVYKDNSSTKICHSMETEPSNKKVIELLMPRSSDQFDDTLDEFGTFKDFEVLAKCEGLKLKPIFTIGWHHYLLYNHLIENGKCKIDDINNIEGYDLSQEPMKRLEQLKTDLNHLLKLNAVKEYPTENSVEAIPEALS